MAPGADWSCPICHNTRSDVASALPCNDHFCLGCILRWAKTNPTCPLCSRPMETVRFSERSEWDYLHFAITGSEELAEDSTQAGSAPFHLAQNNPHHSGVSRPPSPQRLFPDEQGSAEPEFMAGILPGVWAELFQRQQQLLDPVLPWLRWRLETVYQDQWWRAEAAEGSILHGLCVCGPNAETLVQLLEPLLGGHTPSLVYGIINVIAGQCSDEARRLVCFHQASTNSTSSSYTSSWEVTLANGRIGSEVEEKASTSETGFRQSHSHPPSMPTCSEQDQPQEEQEQMVAAGPSAQGCSLSAPGHGRDRSSRKRRRARKRRAPLRAKKTPAL